VPLRNNDERDREKDKARVLLYRNRRVSFTHYSCDVMCNKFIYYYYKSNANSSLYLLFLPFPSSFLSSIPVCVFIFVLYDMSRPLSLSLLAQNGQHVVLGDEFPLRPVLELNLRPGEAVD